jgi:hypothetical protein
MGRRQARRRPDGTPVMSQLQSFWNDSAQARKQSGLRPGRRGWMTRAAGRVNYIESPVEYQGTTVQVEGLWPFVIGSGSPVVGVPRAAPAEQLDGVRGPDLLVPQQPRVEPVRVRRRASGAG